jgi:hypothetical protein
MSQSLGPLSVGNVVSAALRLYRDHFKTYFGVSLVACFWVLVPFLAIIPIGIIVGLLSVASGSGDSGNVGVIVLLMLVTVPLWFVLLIYCVAKSLTNAAVISRLVFGFLNNKPETVIQVRTQLKPKTWTFWTTQFVLGIWLNIVCFPAALLRQFAYLFPVQTNGNNGITLLLIIVAELIYWGVYLWFFSRYFFTELPLALESNIQGPIQAIGRTWQLTKGFGWRILLIVTVAFMITIPVFLIAGIPMFIAFVSAASSLANYSYDLPPTNAVVTIVLGFLFSIVLFIILNIAALPFWQAVKGVIYYDIRSRREGLGLDLRDS